METCSCLDKGAKSPLEGTVVRFDLYEVALWQRLRDKLVAVLCWNDVCVDEWPERLSLKRVGMSTCKHFCASGL